jgi:hypothetical protein
MFFSDGGADIREVQLHSNPEAERYLDWFHITMRLTVMGQYAKGLDTTQEKREEILKSVESVRCAPEIMAVKSRLQAEGRDTAGRSHRRSPSPVHCSAACLSLRSTAANKPLSRPQPLLTDHHPLHPPLPWTLPLPSTTSPIWATLNC